MMPLLMSCSKQGRDSALCWLRPSCVPSDNPPSPPKRIAEPKASSQASRSVTCQPSAKTTVTSKNPSITISYTEPKVNAMGRPLSNLSKTTIYYDVGRGFVQAKERTATSPQGGGKIVETIQIPVQSETPVETTICVVATDSRGLASYKIP